MRTGNTIAAIATAVGAGGISIIRISGGQALETAEKVLDKSIAGVPSHTIHLRRVVDEGEILDQVLVTVMRAPRSYTGEDTVEINCHGGPLVTERVLEAVFKAGALPAEPGEFSKRAFLNGKMDLSQAEAVMDVIDAKNRYALKAGISQLNGRLSEAVRHLRGMILDETAWIEAALDDPEHYDLTGYPEELSLKTEAMIRELDGLLKNADSGRVMKEGISTVILGKPNAGKSSLLNLLAGSERAIVTEIAGTTRDTLTEHIRLAGLSLNLTDTAGIRESDDQVERIGVERARAAAADADLLLVVIDSSSGLAEDDTEILASAEGKNAIVLLNKSDLGNVSPALYEEVKKRTSHPVIIFSAKEGTGLPEMEQELKDMFYRGEIDFNDQIYITNARHKDALRNARNSLLEVRKSIEAGMPEDFFSIDLMDAYEALGTITGETVGEDVIERIFEKFCTGK